MPVRVLPATVAALAGPAASSALAPPADGPANLATVAAAAGQLRGAQAVVVTLGPDGLLAATGVFIRDIAQLTGIITTASSSSVSFGDLISAMQASATLG